jgi:hypothetical protein
MYEPNQQEEVIMEAYKDLGYQVWWNGYDITSNTTENVRSIVISLINKGWTKSAN